MKTVLRILTNIFDVASLATRGITIVLPEQQTKLHCRLQFVFRQTQPVMLQCLPRLSENGPQKCQIRAVKALLCLVCCHCPLHQYINREVMSLGPSEGRRWCLWCSITSRPHWWVFFFFSPPWKNVWRRRNTFTTTPYGPATGFYSPHTHMSKS